MLKGKEIFKLLNSIDLGEFQSNEKELFASEITELCDKLENLLISKRNEIFNKTITHEYKIKILKNAILRLKKFKVGTCCNALNNPYLKKCGFSWLDEYDLSIVFPLYTKENAFQFGKFKSKYQWFKDYDFPNRIKFLEWILSHYKQ
ncbi:MAG: hypothetical protein LBN95_01650 [Prevotellaceae bacterium]|jgi:hypothetical protein|nr:hypothetical protein [Prevotellaceae bacterium]